MAGDDRSHRIPTALRKMLRKPPIMAGEDRAEYDELVEIVRKEINPRQPQEWMLMADIVDAEWELLRLRGLKVGMLHAALPRALNSQIVEGGGLPQLDPEMDPGLALRKHLFGMLLEESSRSSLQSMTSIGIC